MNKKKMFVTVFGLILIISTISLTVFIFLQKGGDKTKSEEEVVSYPVVTKSTVEQIDELLSKTPIYFSFKDKSYKSSSLSEVPGKVAENPGIFSSDKKYMIYLKFNQDKSYTTDGKIYLYNFETKEESIFLTYSENPDYILGGIVGFSPDGKYVTFYQASASVGSLVTYDFTSKEQIFRKHIYRGRFAWKSKDELIYVGAYNDPEVGREYEMGWVGNIYIYNFLKSEDTLLKKATEIIDYGYGEKSVFTIFNSEGILNFIEANFVEKQGDDPIDYRKTKFVERFLDLNTDEYLERDSNLKIFNLIDIINKNHPAHTISNFQENTIDPSWVLFTASPSGPGDTREIPAYNYVVNLSNIEGTLTEIRFNIGEEATNNYNLNMYW